MSDKIDSFKKTSNKKYPTAYNGDGILLKEKYG